MMKKIILTVAFLAITSIAAAQENEQQPNDDQLQQQAPRSTQVQTERASKIEAVKTESNTAIESEKASKDQGQSQKQTKAQPVGINPTATDAKPKDLSKQRKIMSEDSKRQN